MVCRGTYRYLVRCEHLKGDMTYRHLVRCEHLAFDSEYLEGGV